jgi:DNA polymerase-1
MHIVKQTCIILDTSSFQHRAFHVAKERPTYTKEGVPTYAVNLFRRMIQTLRKDYKPDYMVAACDCKEQTFRTKLYPQYKATRQTPHPEYLQQLDGFRAVLHEFKIPIFEMPGYEADDIIGTLCQHIECDILIATGDKDMAQLVDWSGHVKILNTNKNKILDSDGVLDEYGVTPAHIVDYLSLVGDTSDNVPGCKGVGPDGAIMLLKMFCDVEDIIRHVGEISSNRYRHAIQEHTAEILLSKRLVTIDCHVPGVLHCYKV